jgi:hypothetical protein
MMNLPKNRNFLDYFKSKYKVLNNGCWEWQGAGRYGKLNFLGKTMSAHTVSYWMFRGNITKGYYVCHTCDFGRCVNPEHLFLGTPNDNMQDKMEKKRHKAWSGENHGMSKLTSAQVLEIRKLCKIKKRHNEIAKMFNVSSSYISAIKRGVTWPHLQEEI